MKKIISPLILTLILVLSACRPHHEHQGGTVVAEQEIFSESPVSYTSRSTLNSAGEKAIPSFEGNLIKVNNKLCAVSRGLMDEKTLGTFKGQVAYEGSNPKFKGKIFEFNYCCGMCQKMFPSKFQKDPDSILKFHGLM